MAVFDGSRTNPGVPQDTTFRVSGHETTLCNARKSQGARKYPGAIAGG